MALINWDKLMKTGHAEIDAEHKELVALVNQLAEAMENEAGRPTCIKLFNQLITYTEKHFDMEEDLMAKHLYAGAALHMAEHSRLVEQMINLKSKFNDGSIWLMESPFGFMEDWLVYHIMTCDKALVDELSKS